MKRILAIVLLLAAGACKQELSDHMGKNHRESAVACTPHSGPTWYPDQTCQQDSDCQAPHAICVGDANQKRCGVPCTQDTDCADTAQRCIADANGTVCTTVTTCSQSSDCRAGGLGCMSDGNANICAVDACVTDADCPGGGVCDCDTMSAWRVGMVNYCVAANCRTDADCPRGHSCAPSSSDLSYSLAGYYCHTDDDGCNDNSDCPPTDDPQFPAICQYSTTNRNWQCQVANAIE